MYFTSPSYATTIVDKSSNNYPSSLRSLGDDAPESLFCVGNVSLLNEQKALIIGKAAMDSQTVQKTDEMLSALKDYHIVNMANEGVEYYTQQSHCESNGSIILLGGTNNLDSYEYDDFKPLIDDVLASKGLIISLYADNDDFIDKFYNLNMVLLAMSDVVGCVEAEDSANRIIIEAAKIGKEVRLVQ